MMISLIREMTELLIHGESIWGEVWLIMFCIDGIRSIESVFADRD